MKYELLINKCLRLPLHKALELVHAYEQEVGFKAFAEQQKALDILAHKTNTQKMFKDEAFQSATLYLHIMCRKKDGFAEAAFEKLKEYPMVIWIEAIGTLKDTDIEQLLKNFGKQLPPSLIETFIIQVDDNMQTWLIEKYKSFLDVSSPTYENFYYSLCDDGRKKLQILFPGVIHESAKLLLSDVSEKNFTLFVQTHLEELKKMSIDEIVEMLLLKTESISIMMDVLEIFKEELEHISSDIFEIFITRYLYLRNNRSDYGYSFWDFDEQEEQEVKREYCTDLELLHFFSKQFHSLGLERTLALFDAKVGYYTSTIGEEIFYAFLPSAYEDETLNPYLNDQVIHGLMQRVIEVCRAKKYTKEEFYSLVQKLEVLEKPKLAHDDYIEAIIACGQLIQDKVIHDQDSSFLLLREKFIRQTMLKIKRDGTYLEDIRLYGVFYRLLKGSLDFTTFYDIKTYRGLIYLSKCGTLVENADFVTQFLSDIQLAKLNIAPLLHWKKSIQREESPESMSFFERMGLQLLCFFGEIKGKYLLEAGIKGNRMENLFDGIDYKRIEIGDDGVPCLPFDLLQFLFGKGSVKESQSIINQMIRGELSTFEKYFTEVCNTYDDLLEKCNGVLTVKRIVNHFEDVPLPIALKPDELVYKRALKEMNTMDVYTLQKAVSLCNAARDRGYSTIPKVKGSLGDFTYEILDYKDSFAIAVGYLSSCCFTVEGISHTALEHAMQSINGRIFVVYYKGNFLAQSWMWRNGDVVCFDSVEAGGTRHYSFDDDLNVVDVYQKVARAILSISKDEEDEIQRVKVVTVGKSDYRFHPLEEVKGQVARPLEKNVYVYDSNTQYILAGEIPPNVRYGPVGVQYYDPRGKVICIRDMSHVDIDDIDEAMLKLSSLYYQTRHETISPYPSDYKEIFIGDDWFIIRNQNGDIDCEVIQKDARAYEECRAYANRYNLSVDKFEDTTYDLPEMKLVKHLKYEKRGI